MNAVFLQSIIVIDTVLIAPLGVEALAALGLASSFVGILNGMLLAFAAGTQLLLAQAFGAENKELQRQWFYSGLVINLMIATLGLVFIFVFGNRALSLLATNADMAKQAYVYLAFFSLAVIGVAVAQNLTVYFNSVGRSRVPFFSNLIELPVNALLSWVLINGHLGLPAMGIAGAALGSGAAVLIRCVYLQYVMRSQRLLVPNTQDAKTLRQTLALKAHFWQALPIAANFITMVLSMNVCMMIYARLGVQQFAALTLLLPWMRVAGNAATGWAQATGISVGQILGRSGRDYLDEFVARAWRVALCIALVVACFYVSMYAFFDTLYPDLQEETRDYLWQFLPLLLVLPFIRTSNTVCGHVLRAGGDAAYVFKVHASTQWLVTVPLSALFVLVFQLSVFWVFALILLEESIKAIPFHRRLWGGQWKHKI